MTSPNSKQTLFLIDGSGYIFRAFFGVRRLTNAEGMPTNAIFGFTKMLLKLIREEQPTHLAIAFDPPGKNFRHEMYPDYKANRPPAPEDLVPQFPWIHKVVDAFQIPRLIHQGVEADDILGTIARTAEAKGWDVRIVTGDKDLMQIVTDKVFLYDDLRVQRGAAAEPEVSEKDVLAKFGVPPNQVVDILALAGDTSDNVPGVKGIGPKIAAELVQKYGDLESILAAAPEVKQKMRRQRLIEFAEMARLSKRLVTIDQHVDIEMSPEKALYKGPAREELRQIFRELDFTRLMQDSVFDAGPMAQVQEAEQNTVAAIERMQQGDLFAASGPDPVQPASEAPAKAPVTPATRTGSDARLYQIVATEGNFEGLIQEIQEHDQIGLSAEADSREAEGDQLVGIGVSLPNGKSAYLPLGHTIENAIQLDKADVCIRLCQILKDKKTKVYIADGKSALVRFAREGGGHFPIYGDPTIASYLLDPDTASHRLHDIAKRRLGYSVDSREDLCGSGKNAQSLASIPIDRAAPFVVERADLAMQLGVMMEKDLEDAKLSNLYRELELPLSVSIAKMEAHGLRIDIDRLGRMSAEFEKRLAELEETAHQEAGEEFNLQSPSQISKLLFDKIGLRVVKRTKTGPSTDSSVLEQLESSHPLPGLILQHRSVAKLKNTYVDVLPRLVRTSTGRVHTRLHQTVAATGRLSSSDPNLQNIPIRTQEGRKIREAFVASDDHVLVALDYSQIELRILAHVSQDPVMLDSFIKGEDVHRRTASEIFEVTMEEVTRDQRGQAKAINFGLLYGMGVLRLARELGMKRTQAKEFLEKYFERYKGIKSWNDEALAAAHAEGAVYTLFGRRRLLPELQSANRGTVARGERLAINTPIQGTAADLIKRAMVDADTALQEHVPKAKMLLQVHDELVLDVPKSMADMAFATVKGAMEAAAQFDVPLVVDGQVGNNWAEVH
jgi:DNA polymerase I